MLQNLHCFSLPQGMRPYLGIFPTGTKEVFLLLPRSLDKGSIPFRLVEILPNQNQFRDFRTFETFDCKLFELLQRDSISRGICVKLNTMTVKSSVFNFNMPSLSFSG